MIGERAMTVDSRGRLTLGPKFANRTVLVREVDDTEVVVTLAAVIPEREAWLFANPQARQLVSTGIEQAAAGQFAETAPDPAADLALLAEAED
ncbi:MAG: hypothetical protein GY856_12405 [bacterium]|nr:hypothetical protein [bacterium]